MSAVSLKGLPVAIKLREQCAVNVERLGEHRIVPKLAVVVATDNEATHWYVRSIAKQARNANVLCEVLDLGSNACQEYLADQLTVLAEDPSIHGIILQTPLPDGVDVAALTSLIPPHKDVDGANPESLGRLSMGLPAFAPATAQAVVEILEHYEIPLIGKDIAVVGRSTVVGKPLAQLLLHRDATPTMCHSRTNNLAEHTKRASIVVVAVGRPNLISSEHLTSGSVVIDVGTNVTASGALIGDVDAEDAAQVAGALTPVPGGVGTVTSSLLVLNTCLSALESSLGPDRLPRSEPQGAGTR